MGHRHTVSCFERYTPCGEHHRHDYNCGGGELTRECPDYEPLLQPDDVRIKTYSLTTEVRLTHIPTGLTTCRGASPSQHCNRLAAMEALQQLLIDRYKESFNGQEETNQ